MKQHYGKILTLSALILFIFACNKGEEAKPKTDVTLDLKRPDLSALHVNIADELRNLHRDVLQKYRNESLSVDERVAALEELGLSYFAHDFYDVSADVYRAAIDLKPELERLHYRRGLSERRATLNDAAEQSWLKVLETSSYDFMTNVRLGELYGSTQRWDKAGEHYERALKVKPDEAMAHYGMGQFSTAKGDHEAAVNYYLATLSRQPDATIVNYPLGLAYRRLGDTEKSERFVRRRGDTAVRLLDPFEIDAAIVVSDSILRNILIMASDEKGYSHKDFLGYVRSNFRGKARSQNELLKILEKKLATDSFNPFEVSRLCYAMGDIYRFQGKYQESLKQLSYAVRLEPGYTELYLDFARTALEANQPDNALKLMKSFVEKRPDYVDGLLVQASALIRKNDPASLNEAHDVLDGILARAPEQYGARVLKAQAYFQSRDYKRASQAYEAVVLEEMPALEKAQHYNTYAKLVQEQGDLDKAISLFQKSLDTDPGFIESKYDMASVYVAKNRFKDAARLYEEVVAAQPMNERAHLSHIGALVMGKRYKEALETLEDALLTNPNSIALAHLAARLYAICPKESLRDPARSLAYANAVYKRSQSAIFAETMAMALAANGQWDKAIELQDALVESARKQGLDGAARALRSNLSRYESKMSCCKDMSIGTLLAQPGM